MNAFAHISYAARTDVGRKRKNNEDAFGAFHNAGVFCVADGMGGGDDGEIASAAVVKSVGSFAMTCRPPPNVGYSAEDVAGGVAMAVDEASSWIFSRASERKLKGCGSTFVGVCFDATVPSQAVALHAGDSRLYRIRGLSIKQITKDHSAVELIGAKDESSINPCFRGVILRAVGIHPSVDVERTPFQLKDGDRIVICSDGLSKMVDDRKIASIVHGMATPDAAADALIAAANEAGGVDNVTAVVLFVGKMPPGMPGMSLPLPEAATGSTDDAGDADTSSTGSGYKPDTDTADEPRTIVTTTSAGTLAAAGQKLNSGNRRGRVVRIVAAVSAVVAFAAFAASCGIYLARMAKARESRAEAERERGMKALAEASVHVAPTSGVAATERRREDVEQAKAVEEPIAQTIERELELGQSRGADIQSEKKVERSETVADAVAEPATNAMSEAAAGASVEAVDGNEWKLQVLPVLVNSCAPTNSEAFVGTVRRFPVKGGVETLRTRFQRLRDETLDVASRRKIASAMTADMQDVCRDLREYSKRRMKQLDAAIGEHTTRSEIKAKLESERAGLAAFREATENFLEMDASSGAAQKVCADVVVGVAKWFKRIE